MALLAWTGRCLEIMGDVVSGTSTEIMIKPEQVADMRRVVEECRSHLACLTYDHAYYALDREESVRSAEVILPHVSI